MASVLAFAAGCGVGDAPTLEGPVPTLPTGSVSPGAAHQPGPSPQPSASGTVPALDLRAVLLGDPGVDSRIKAELINCSGCDLLRPLYARLTGSDEDDVVVSVREPPGTGGASGWAADADGDDLQATYAYQVQSGTTRQIYAFTGDDYAVAVQGGDLIVMEPLYAALDPRCCPSGVRILRNRWNGSRLVTVQVTDTTGAPSARATAPDP